MRKLCGAGDYKLLHLHPVVPEFSCRRQLARAGCGAGPEGQPGSRRLYVSLEEQVPKFGAKWGDKKMLEAVSGIVKAEPEPEPEPEPKVKPEPKDKQPEPAKDGDEARKPKGRARGGSAAAASRRGGRAKAASSKAAASTINID